VQLPNIEIKIDGIVYENTFAQDISIDRTNLEEEFATHAEKYYYYAFLAQVAEAKAAFKKNEVKQVYARIDAEKRGAVMKLPADVKATVKYTEKMYESEVITDPRYVEAQKEEIEANLLAGQLSEAARAMAQRRDMLVQLGGMFRQSQAPTRVVEQQAPVVEGLITDNNKALRRKPVR